jgi:hypothetical protein
MYSQELADCGAGFGCSLRVGADDIPDFSRIDSRLVKQVLSPFKNLQVDVVL